VSEKVSETNGNDANTDLESAQAKIEELTNICQRLQAEFDNFRKRAQDEKFAENTNAKANCITQLLPTIDAMELSLNHADTQDTEALKQVVQGMHLIHNQLSSVLHDQGLEEISAIGTPFDPYRHEAIAVVPAEDPSQNNTVAKVQQKGYLFKGKVLRSAKVIVARQEEETNTEDNNGEDEDGKNHRN